MVSAMPSATLLIGFLAIPLAAAAFTLHAQAPAADLEANTCTLRFRSLDDQADDGIRSMNAEIALIRRDIESSLEDGPVPPDEIGNLSAAEARKAALVQKHHAELNEVRKRCDILRSAENRVP